MNVRNRLFLTPGIDVRNSLFLGLTPRTVYFGTLNKTLIGMMLGGLAATLGTLACTGMGASAFEGRAVAALGRFVMKWAINPALLALPESIYAGGPLTLWHYQLSLLGNSLIDALGLAAIVTGGVLARLLQARFPGGDSRPVAPPS